MSSKLTRRSSNGRSCPHGANRPVSSEWTQRVIDSVVGLPSGTPKIDYLKDQFLTKFVSKDTDPALVRRERAIAKWLATEERNAVTNDRLQNMPEDYQILPRVEYGRFIAFCSTLVASIIGETVPEEALYGSFSGGASTGRVRTRSFAASKYLGQADVTTAALPLFLSAMEGMEAWSNMPEDLEINLVPGNVLFTVPKKTDIDRVAAKEPELNMFLQKGAGDVIRRGLKRVGIDLNNQLINRDLARHGSLTGSLATLDLSSASDSVTTQLVFSIVSPFWFVHLDSIRSHVTDIDGETHQNEMFSSMGNGFTFELESLLFYSIARTVAYFTGVSGVISVYGDDIIVPVAMYDDLVWVLGVLGFSVNEDKSFASGPFRESCGGHYYNGCDITPFYLRKPIERLTDLIHVANAIRKWSETEQLDILEDDLYDIWVALRDAVPRSLWGGSDLASITQLVADVPASKRLIAATKELYNGPGGYIHWLNITFRRPKAYVDLLVAYKEHLFPIRRWSEPLKDVEAISTSTRTNVLTEYRYRPALNGTRPKKVFLAEAFDVPS